MCCSCDHILYRDSADRKSALMYACEYAKIEVVEVLLEIYESLGIDDDLDDAIRACVSSDCERDAAECEGAVKEYQQKMMSSLIEGH